MSASLMPQALGELRYADRIIKIMLTAMTAQQKIRLVSQLEAAGIAGEGMTRHHERAVILNGDAQPSVSAVQTSASTERAIGQPASDIVAHAARQEILLLTILDALDGVAAPTPALRKAVDAIECFTTCALRNSLLIREAGEHIMETVRK